MQTLNASQMPAQYVEYYQKMGAFWQFVEKTLAQSTLAEKYQNLVTKSLISNPVAAEDAFNSRTELERPVVSWCSLKQLYQWFYSSGFWQWNQRPLQRKNSSSSLAETRDIRYIDVK